MLEKSTKLVILFLMFLFLTEQTILDAYGLGHRAEEDAL